MSTPTDRNCYRPIGTVIAVQGVNGAQIGPEVRMGDTEPVADLQEPRWFRADEGKMRR